MTNNEKTEFVELMAIVSNYYNKPPSEASMMIYWNGLKALPFEKVKELLNLHVQTSAFMPKVSEIIGAAVQQDGRPDPEEAWSIHAPCLNDENPTVVVTDEMATAFGVALNLANDKIAARMAYRETYAREVQNARRLGWPVKWTISPGMDKRGYEAKLVQAATLGRITASYALAALPYPASDDSRKLLEGLVSDQKRLTVVR